MQSTLPVGTVFGRLTVIATIPNRKRHLCRCSCGGEKIVPECHLIGGYVKSCGCWSDEHAKDIAKFAGSRRVHGHASGPREKPARSGTYSSWANMLSRCKPGGDYFGRVSVCDRWKVFVNFLADMGERPEGYSIDRYPDRNGPYAPGNCRWADKLAQNNNTRKNRFITHAGLSLTAAQWEHRLGLPRSTVTNRLRDGWSLDRVLRR